MEDKGKKFDIKNLNQFGRPKDKSSFALTCDQAREIMVKEDVGATEAARMLEHARTCQPCAKYFINLESW